MTSNSRLKVFTGIAAALTIVAAVSVTTAAPAEAGTVLIHRPWHSIHQTGTGLNQPKVRDHRTPASLPEKN
ncbi:MAG: hypothetical protein QOI12_4284 [Alphaproteobacteria bacterium]|nr:hypothetical protein [Alphaproteobacteria bacterium]